MTEDVIHPGVLKPRRFTVEAPVEFALDRTISPLGTAVCLSILARQAGQAGEVGDIQKEFDLTSEQLIAVWEELENRGYIIRDEDDEGNPEWIVTPCLKESAKTKAEITKKQKDKSKK